MPLFVFLSSVLGLSLFTFVAGGSEYLYKYLKFIWLCDYANSVIHSMLREMYRYFEAIKRKCVNTVLCPCSLYFAIQACSFKSLSTSTNYDREIYNRWNRGAIVWEFWIFRHLETHLDGGGRGCTSSDLYTYGLTFNFVE